MNDKIVKQQEVIWFELVQSETGQTLFSLLQNNFCMLKVDDPITF